MRITKIVISAAAALGAVVIGGSWYTGKQVEQRYTELVAQVNERLTQMDQYGIQIRLHDVQLNRGWFSSDVDYRLAVQIDNQDYHVRGSDKLYHGPLPLNRLMKANLVPVMASSESRIEVPSQLKTAVTGEVLLSGQGRLAYNGSWQGQYRVVPIHSDWMVSEAIEYETEFDQEGHSKGKLNIPAMTIYSSEANGLGAISVKNVDYDFNLKEVSPEHAWLNIGQATVKIASLSIDGLDVEFPFSRVVIQDLKNTNRNALNGERVAGESEFSAKVQLGEKQKMLDFGQLQLKVTADSDARATNALLHELGNSAEKTPQFDTVSAQALALVKAGVRLDLSELALENAKGKSQLKLLLNLHAQENNRLANFRDTLNLFKQSSLSIQLNQGMIEELTKQFALLSQHDASHAAQFAKEEWAKLVNMAQKSEFVEVAEEHVKLTLSIDQGKVFLNGQPVPDEQIQGAIFMLLLGLGTR